MGIECGARKEGKNKSCLLTFLERKSRFLVVRKIPNKDNQAVLKTLLPLFKQLREENRIESIPIDNGSEFALLPELERYGICPCISLVGKREQ